MAKEAGLGRFPQVSWSSKGHTAASVPLFVWGVGADRCGGKMDNADVPKRILELPETAADVDQAIFDVLIRSY